MLQLKTVSENKGRGFFATCNIEAGTLILSEKPMIERNILKQELDIFQIEQNFENETDQEIEKETRNSDNMPRIFKSSKIRLNRIF